MRSQKLNKVGSTES